MPKSRSLTAKFRADSALIRELGERLVGQAHIALAELVKNSYDADATDCVVEVAPDQIVVSDNGHGMTRAEFLNYWMTIGTRHKEQFQGLSRNLNRNVTGSKGVGRLAVQFLAHTLEMTTVSNQSDRRDLVAYVNWDEAIEAGRLTEAEASYRIGSRTARFPGGSKHGTSVVMGNLKQEWDEPEIRNLARELWMLQSPTSNYGELLTEKEDPDNFHVKVVSSEVDIKEAFDEQMNAALENYIALIKGEIQRFGRRSEAHVSVTFRNGDKYSERFSVKPLIDHANWEIRIFNLRGHQSNRITVQDARNYFAKFGGVKVYDAGFRLPYYGVDQDWLGIEIDHSHRKNRSMLLPSRLHVPRALNDLPTQGRLFGVVNIDTGVESRQATKAQKNSGDFLKIQVTRDRLVANRAYEELHRAVRWSLDYYATRQRLRESKKAEIRRPRQAPVDVLKRVLELAQEAESRYPADETIKSLVKESVDLAKTIELDRVADESTRVLLGPLAAAGMAAIALEHETRRELRQIRALLNTTREVEEEADVTAIDQLVCEIYDWISRTDRARRVFGPLMDMDDREQVDVLGAREVLTQVVENVEPLIPSVELSVDIPRNLYLPPATFAEWNSLFQNVLVNVSNATLDAEQAKAACFGGHTGRRSWIRVCDNGVGVDLTESEQLFEPFIRRIGISQERRELGLGGMGLGLTIVKMIAEQRKMKVAFVQPIVPWTTAFELSWASKT